MDGGVPLPPPFVMVMRFGTARLYKRDEVSSVGGGGSEWR